MNVSRNVVRGRTFWPDRPALIFEGHTISYRDLDQDSNRAANPIWVTSSTKMPSSGSSARIASRISVCGASLARRRPIMAWRCSISARREGRS